MYQPGRAAAPRSWLSWPKRTGVPRCRPGAPATTHGAGANDLYVDDALVDGQDSCSYSCGRDEALEDQDEALDHCHGDPVRGLAAAALAGVRATTSRNAGSLGGCGSLEQPRNSGVRALILSERRKNKSHRDSRGSGDAGVGHRMHSGRAKHCRRHNRPDEPLRPIGDAGPTQVGGDRWRRAAMLPPSCSPRAIAHPIGRRNCAPPLGKA